MEDIEIATKLLKLLLIIIGIGFSLFLISLFTFLIKYHWLDKIKNNKNSHE